MSHHLKTLSDFWDQTKAGNKHWELRKNDRNYKIGQEVVLYRGVRFDYMYKRFLTARIIDILEDFSGIENGYVILSLCDIEEGSPQQEK